MSLKCVIICCVWNWLYLSHVKHAHNRLLSTHVYYNSTFPNQSRGQRLTTRGGGEGGRTSRRRVWPSPTTPEWSIAGPDVLGTEFYSISASKRRTNAVK